MEEIIPNLLLQGKQYPNLKKNRQGYHKKRRLLANIADEHRRKNPQQNIS